MQSGAWFLYADRQFPGGHFWAERTPLAFLERSLGNEFVADPAAVAGHSLEEGKPYINLGMDSHTMRFEMHLTHLAGTSWTVTAYNNGRDAVVNPILETKLTATFDGEGTISGTAGCNQYRAPYEASSESLTIGLPISTMMHCQEPEGVMEQELAYLAALQIAATYRFRGNLLEMRAADGALAVIFQRRLASVSGTVTYVQRIALPDDAVVIVRISDASPQDPAAEVIGEQIIPTEGKQVPIPYEVPYDPDDIVNPDYSVSARIEDSTGKPLFISDTNIPVVTRDNPTENVEIVVVPVGD
jgi:uncharacterized lipoprotein YbaY